MSQKGSRHILSLSLSEPCLLPWHICLPRSHQCRQAYKVLHNRLLTSLTALCAQCRKQQDWCTLPVSKGAPQKLQACTGTAEVLRRTLASCSFVPRISVHRSTAMSVMPLSGWLLSALAIRAGSNSWPCNVTHQKLILSCCMEDEVVSELPEM